MGLFGFGKKGKKLKEPEETGETHLHTKFLRASNSRQSPSGKLDTRRRCSSSARCRFTIRHRTSKFTRKYSLKGDYYEQRFVYYLSSPRA
jgi:hypothetical protein